MAGNEVNSVTVEDMRPEDVAEVLSIENVSFSTPWSEILFMNEIYKPGSLPKVARIEGRVAGYLCVSHVLDEGHILNVTVHPDFRLRGIASLLVQHALRILGSKDCKKIFLEVRASNGAARALYERSGFCVIGTRKSYYTSPTEEAIIMARYLAPQDGVTCAAIK